MADATTASRPFRAARVRAGDRPRGRWSRCEQPRRGRTDTEFVGPAPPVREALALPNRPGSIKFAAIGDAGRGDAPQYEVSAQMQRVSRRLSTSTSS